jgi:CysZ protein
LAGAVIAIIAYLHPLFPAGWGWLLLEIVCGIALVAAAMAATLVLWMLLQGIFCGIYYGKLARQVELQLGIPPDSLKELPFRQQASDTLGDLASLIAVNMGLLLLHLIPVLGSIGSIAGGLYFNCYFVGREYLDYPLALRGLPRRDKRAFLRKFCHQTLGLGTIVFITNLIPIVGFVIPVTAVVGSVLLHKRLAGTC